MCVYFITCNQSVTNIHTILFLPTNTPLNFYPQLMTILAAPAYFMGPVLSLRELPNEMPMASIIDVKPFQQAGVGELSMVNGQYAIGKCADVVMCRCADRKTMR